MPGELGMFQKQDCRAPWVIQSVLLQKQEESPLLLVSIAANTDSPGSFAKAEQLATNALFLSSQGL